MDLLLIVAVPFLISLLLVLPGIKRLFTKEVQKWGIPLVMVLSFATLLRHFPTIQEQGAYIPPVISWIPELGINLSFYLDGLALLFGLVVTGIGAVIFLYTGFYFSDEEAEKQTRFNVWLSAFAGAMLGLVLSGNMILMFIMWELTSITSFMLIGFYGNKSEDARISAMRALVITGGGGLAMIAGVLLLGGVIGQIQSADAIPPESAAITEQTEETDIEVPTEETPEESTLFAASETDVLPFSFEYTDMLTVETITDHPWYVAILILMMLAAFTKSAQFPFHFWLPGAMSAPTPASAFLHSATMVKAGIYLMARLHPVMYDHPLWVNGLVGIGVLTMAISALFALKQRDLKGLLAYSTTSWLGVLIALIGLPDFAGFKALAIGILGHALYKSALFLSVGSIDHSTGTRNLDKLGNLWKYMPATGVVVILSALSMAGVPLLMGFVAKEVLLDATVNYMAQYSFLGGAATWIVVISAALTGTAGYVLIWDIFFAKEPEGEHIHYHAMPRFTASGPLLLALGGTTLLPFFLDPLIIPLTATVTPKEFELHLIPTGGFANPYFQLSLLALVIGVVVFFGRRIFIGDWQFLPFNGAQAYKGFIDSLEWFADILVRSQNGRIRYYLFYILGVVAVISLSSSLIFNLPQNIQDYNFTPTFDMSSVLNLMLIALAIGAVLASVIIKRHLIAALAIGVFGYAVAGIFVVESAPDVALVQFLVETLATVLIIVMISRISHRQRKEMADELWDSSRVGIVRDVLISAGIGLSVSIFAVTAVVFRPERASISQFHIDNAYDQLAIPDIVSAILTDYRGMDTFVEIIVFAMCSLGILSLLALNRREEGVDELPDDPNQRRETIATTTPFMRTVAYIVFPTAAMLAVVHLLYGAAAPGDGFTAGIAAGLAVALGYIVFGYYDVRRRAGWRSPVNFVSIGLSIAVVNAVLPIFFGGTFMGHWSAEWFDFAGLKLASTLIFEIAIGVTVFGSVGVILESIAHPRDVEVLTGDEAYDPNYSTPSDDNALDLSGRQPAGAD